MVFKEGLYTARRKIVKEMVNKKPQEGALDISSVLGKWRQRRAYHNTLSLPAVIQKDLQRTGFEKITNVTIVVA